jgi:hypothetical protein
MTMMRDISNGYNSLIQPLTVLSPNRVANAVVNSGSSAGTFFGVVGAVGGAVGAGQAFSTLAGIHTFDLNPINTAKDGWAMVYSDFADKGDWIMGSAHAIGKTLEFGSESLLIGMIGVAALEYVDAGLQVVSKAKAPSELATK